MSKEKVPEPEYPNTHTVEFKKGSITYSLIGEPNPDHHSVIWISGMEQSRVNPLDAAEIIAKDGQRQVLIMEQPVWKDGVTADTKKDGQQALDFQAEAVLVAATDAGLLSKEGDGQSKVVDVAAHSFGGLIAERAKQLAKADGITSLEQSNGSRWVLMAPAGGSSTESLASIAKRWTLSYMPKTMIEAGTLDPSKLKGKALQKNVLADPNKAWGEVKAMAHDRIDFHRLGEALLVVYPEDKMFPESQKAVKSRTGGLINELMASEAPIAIATPVNPEDVAVKGLKLAEAKTLIFGKARKEFALSHRGAGHNDPTDNPARTAQVLLDYFDRGSSVPAEAMAKSSA